MLNAQFRPLDHWPGERTRHTERARFKVTYERSLDLLESELAKLRAKNITIQIDGLTLDHVRNDGWPKSTFFNLRYSKCGVILSFESPKGAISIPCDKFNSWKDNIRAIALSLEALRQVDRYGVTRGNEQYRGWAQIEPPTNGMDRAKALEVIASILGVPREDVGKNPAAFVKEARIRYHPDSTQDEAVKKTRHEMSVLISKAEEVLCGEGGK